jgi:hypothetical protein
MPLCSFGCDYLYEKGFVYIEGGIIKDSGLVDDEYFDELSVITPLIGKTIEQRWLEGSESYFKKPSKKKQADA